uniref:Uncharacterized protein n=1 Tax=Anguilla anguilla TaxID=7936 RepID=A0A0E9T2C1_ANGAN
MNCSSYQCRQKAVRSIFKPFVFSRPYKGSF